MNVAIDITPELWNAFQATLARTNNPLELLMLGARAAANRVRANYDRLEHERPNKDGYPRQHLWSQLRRAVQNPVLEEGGAVIAVNHVAAALRYFGGDVHPVRGKFLTLPAVAEAYGKRAREFSNLRFGFAIDPRTDSARPALIKADATRVRFGRQRKDGSRKVIQGERIGGKAIFWLVRSVHQDPDTTTLPPDDELVGAALDAMQNYLDRLWSREKGARI